MPKLYTKQELVSLVQRAVWLSGTGVYGWNLLWKYLGPLLEEKDAKSNAQEGIRDQAGAAKEDQETWLDW
jgi:hypothetical protein